jgi:hypothetical protein
MTYDQINYETMREYEHIDDDAKQTCGETVDHLVERVAIDLVKQTEALAAHAATQALCITERHELVRKLQALEPKENVSLKALRERLTTLQAINRFQLCQEPTDKLKARLEVLTAIDKIDIVTDGRDGLVTREAMKALRARLRTLEKIVETAEAVAALPPTPEAIKAKAEADLLAAKAARALAKANGIKSNVVPLKPAPPSVEGDYKDDGDAGVAAITGA